MYNRLSLKHFLTLFLITSMIVLLAGLIASVNTNNPITSLLETAHDIVNNGKLYFSSKNEIPKNIEIDNEFLLKSPELLSMNINSILPDNVPVIMNSNVRNDRLPAVFVYQTHNRESWLSEIKDVKSNPSVHHPQKNITLVGKYFTELLTKNGIPIQYDDTDYIPILLEREMSYSKSYALSLETLNNALLNNSQIDYIFDFHRDSLPRKDTTVTIGNKEYARIAFVIGKGNKNWEQNFEFAKKLEEILNRKYPGICRPLVEKDHLQGNGEYNQSISPNALTVEIGGIGNTLEESNRTMELLAEVFSKVYLDALAQISK